MSDNAVMERPTHAVAELIDSKKIKEYLDAFGLGNNLTEQEVKQFTEIAQAFNLNPFKREIYCIPYGEGEKRKLSVITGYEVYLKRAERIGKLKGWKAWTEGTVEFKTKSKTVRYKDKKTGADRSFEKEYRAAEGDLRAIVEIYRSDWDHPFTHEVHLDEYYQDNEMWGSKPRTMLKKVVTAQGFRLAFPDEFGGMPYTSEELPDDMVNVTPHGEKKPEAPQKPDSEAKKNPAPEAKKNYKQFNDDLAEIAKMVVMKDGNGELYFDEGEKAKIAADVSAVTKMPNDDPEAKAAAMHTCLEAVKAKLDLKKQAREALEADIDEAADEGFRDQQEELEM